MKFKLLMVIVIFMVISYTAFSQTNERNRGLYIDAGIGMVINDLTEINDDNVLDNIAMSIDANIGWAILQNIYIVGTLPGFSVKLYKYSDYMQINTCLFGLGVRFYPLPSMKYLQFGTDLRFGKIVLYTNNSDVKIFNTDPFGVIFSAAYDFDLSMTGMAFLIGGEVLLDYFIETKTTITGFSIFAKFVFK
ncbi:hypothetical protein [Treponema sp. R80B11-R83G3]